MNILKILAIVILFFFETTNAQVSISFLNSNSDVGLCDSKIFIANNLTPPSGGWSSTPFLISIEPFITTSNSNPLTMANPWPPFPSCGVVNNLFPPIELTDFTVPPGFSASTPTWNGNTKCWDVMIQAGSGNSNSNIATIEYIFDFDCSISNNFLPGGSYFFFHRWYYQANLINVLPTPVVVHYPELLSVPTTQPTFLDAHFGSQQDWIFTFQNIGSASGNIKIVDFFVDNCLTSNGLQLFNNTDIMFNTSPNNSIPQSWINYSVQQDIAVGQGDYLFFKYSAVITGCAANCNTGGAPDQPAFVLKWRCSDNQFPNPHPHPSLNPICTSCKELRNFVLFNNGNSSFEISRDVTIIDDQTATFDATLCQGEARRWRFNVKNTGNAKLPSVFVSFNTINQDAFSVVPTSSVAITCTSATSCIVNASTIFNSSLLPPSQSCTPFPSVQLYENFVVKITDLEVNGTASIVFDAINYYSDDVLLFNSSKMYNQWRVFGEATTVCGNNFNANYTPGTLIGTNNGISGHSTSTGSTYDDVHLSGVLNNSQNHSTVYYPPGSPNPKFATDELVKLLEFGGLFGDNQDKAFFGFTTPNSPTPISGYLKVEFTIQNGLSISNPNNISIVLPTTASIPRQLTPFKYGDVADAWCTLNPYNLNPIGPVKYTPQQGIPYHYYPQNNCICDTEKKYTVYFDISQFDQLIAGTTYTREDIFTYGKLLFNLTSCCGTPLAAFSDFDVKISALPNSSCYNYNTGNGIFESVIGSNSVVCWLPLLHYSNGIYIHCPGCIAPGVIVDDYNISRTNLGLEDGDNDGVAESIGGITYWPNQMAVQSSYNQYPNLKLNYSSFGDELEDYLIAHFEDGDRTGSNDGYYYDDMTNTLVDVHLNFLQLKRDFPFSNLNGLNISVTGFDFYIDDPLQGTNPIDLEMFPAIAKQFQTVVHITVNPQGLAPFLTIVGDELLFTFSTALLQSLHQNPNSIPDVSVNTSVPNFLYNEDQQYRLRVRYKICGNMQAAIPGNPIDISIKNHMFLTGAQKAMSDPLIPMPQDASDICIEIPPQDGRFDFNSSICNNPNYISQSGFADYYTFYCETFGCEHYYVPISTVNNTFYNTYAYEHEAANECTGTIDVISYSNFNVQMQPTYKFFDYEYKIPMISPNKVEVELPTGWHWAINQLLKPDVRQASFSSSNLGPPGNSIFIDVSNNTTLLTNPDRISIDPNFNSTYYKCLTNINDPTPFISDEKNIQRFSILLEPDNCNVVPVQADPSDAEITFNEILPNQTCFNPPSCSIQDFNITNGLNAPSQLTMPSIAPNLNLVFSPPISNITNNTVSWYFEFSNLNISLTPNSYATNPYFYINLPGSPNVNVSVNFNDVATNSIPPPPATYNYSISNAQINQFMIFSLPSDFSLNTGRTYFGVLTMTFNNCTDIPAIIPLFYGWNCSSPTVFSSPPLCALLQPNQTLTTVIAPGELTGTEGTVTPNTYIPCNTDNPLSMTAVFTNTGYLDLTLQDISINLPANSIIQINPNVTPFISSQCLGSPNNGLTLTTTASPTTWDFPIVPVLKQGECFEFNYSIYTNGCHFGPLELPSVFVNSNDACGNLVTAQVDITPINQMQGQSDCVDCYRIMKTVNNTIAAIGEGVTFEIVVEGNNNQPTQSLDISDTYPPNFIEAPLTTNWPISIYVPAIGLSAPILISGAFNDLGSCSGFPNSTINTAYLTQNSAINAQACLDVVCPAISFNWIISSPADAVALFASANSNIIQGQLIKIDDYFSLEINQDIEFKNCTFYMGSGSDLHVIDNSTLNLKSSEFTSCPYMWKGIFVDGGSSLNSNLTIIRDAEAGVFGYHGANIRIVDSEILDFVTGVTNEPTGTNTFHTIIGEIYGTDFGMTGLILKKEYTGQPLHGKIGRAGISLIDIDGFTIGDDSKDPNNFFNINYGIDLYHTNSTVTNNHFQLIRADNVYKTIVDQQMGVAMHAVNYDQLNPPTDLRLRPLASGTNTIEKCDIGLFNRYYNVNATSIKMNDVETGIRATKNAFCENIISNCVIHAFKTGVYWYDNDQAHLMQLIGNRIYSKGFTCVELHEFFDQNRAHYDISFNPNLESVLGGKVISLNNVNDAIIGYNFNIFSRDPQNPNQSSMGIGIEINGGSNNNIFCNNTNTDLLDKLNFGFKGMDVSISQSNSIYCNHFNNSSIGAYYGGSCTNTRFRGNMMFGNYEGLHLDNTAIIDDQVHHGNLWVNYFSNEGAVNYNSGNEFLSEFLVHTLSLPYHPITYPTSGWFGLDPGYTPFNCTTSQSCLAFGPEPDPALIEPYLTDRLIASDSLSFLIYDAETRNELRAQLLERIQSDSSQYLSDSLFADFYTEMLNSPLGELNNVGLQLAGALEIDAVSYSTLALTDSLIELTLDSIYLLDSLNRDAPISGFENIRLQLTLQLSNLRNVSAAILNAHALKLGLVRDSLLLINSGIQPSELPDVNRHTVFSIAAEYQELGVSVLIQNQVTLLNIAHQCPYQGGPAVYIARSLLRILNDSIEYYDDIVCLQAGFYRLHSTSADKFASAIKVVPNPASNYIEIFSIDAPLQHGVISIYNSFGEIVYKNVTDLSSKLKTVSVINLVPGMYYIQIKEGIHLYSEKFNVIR